MGDFADIQNKIKSLKSFNTTVEVQQIVTNKAGQLVKLQKEQLYEGRGVDGDYIHPFYSEDPYFKKPGAAQRYAKWKQKITPNPERPEDVPNLFINGKYVYDTMLVKLTGGTFSLESDFSKGQQILNEHPNAAGLGPTQRSVFANNTVLPEFKKVFEEKTGFKL